MKADTKAIREFFETYTAKYVCGEPSARLAFYAKAVLDENAKLRQIVAKTPSYLVMELQGAQIVAAKHIGEEHCAGCPTPSCPGEECEWWALAEILDGHIVTQCKDCGIYGDAPCKFCAEAEATERGSEATDGAPDLSSSPLSDY